jgi:HD-GYP domain-containing protein (c-di-GMP phosphodiesterase class II)
MFAGRAAVSPSVQIKLSEVMSALSYALDLVEGQPQGHAIRSCILGMRIGRDLRLPGHALSDLFYALLMKDLGCSSNAAKMCYLFAADDRDTKRNAKTVNWTNFTENLRFAFRSVAPTRSWFGKAMKVCHLAITGKRAAKQLIQIRCERGANIARLFGLPESTAQAIHNLDEHWNGHGHPDGVRGEDIPLPARIMSLAQTAEVFFSEHGLEATRQMVRDRAGTWFDPRLAKILLRIKDSDQIWNELHGDSALFLPRYEPEDQMLFADDERLDRIAEGFGQVIDAKSPWTFHHSMGVADVSVGIGKVLGMAAPQLRDLRRAALLHDVGKLGVSNLILDKPGKLNAEELAEIRRHPAYTQQILQRVAGFSNLADIAASHHERLDGKGYHRGWSGLQLGTMTRILCVADMYEALAAHRPYRQDLSGEEVTTILQKNSPAGLCPETLEALQSFLANTGFTPYRIAA